MGFREALLELFPAALMLDLVEAGRAQSGEPLAAGLARLRRLMDATLGCGAMGRDGARWDGL